MQPFVFTGVALLVGAVAMMLVAERTRDRRNGAWDRQTLAFSIFEVLMFLFFVFLVGQVSATEANFLNRISIPLVLVSGWLVFSRRPLPLDGPGIGLVLIGVVLLVSALEDSVRWQALGLSVLIGLCKVGRTMAAETHKGFGRAVSIADRCYCDRAGARGHLRDFSTRVAGFGVDPACVLRHGRGRVLADGARLF